MFRKQNLFWLKDDFLRACLETSRVRISDLQFQLTVLKSI